MLRRFTKFRTLAGVGLTACITLYAVSLFPALSPFRNRFVFEDRAPTVVQQIQQLSRLETVSYQEQKYLEGHKEWGGLPKWLMKDQIGFLAHGEVVAGIDLSSFSRDRVRLEGDKAIVSLPKPRVFHVRLDNRSSQVCNRSTGWLNRPDPQLESEVRRQAEQILLASALQEGIMDRARVNAERSVRHLLQTLGAKSVQFT